MTTEPKSTGPKSTGPKSLVGLAQVQVERDGTHEDDWLAVEAPLEIRLNEEPLVVTMRTPGHDRELAAGFLFTEGIIQDRQDLEAIEPCADPLAYDPDNLIFVRLSTAASERYVKQKKSQREFAATAACGLCGKARIEDLYQRLPLIEPVECSRSLVQSLPDRMAPAQSLFQATGGLHAAALFSLEGELLDLFEDIGRHNAVDKVIGRALLQNRIPLKNQILAVSARAGFEIVQKAMMAAIPVLVAMGAASSLAAETAKRGGLSLYSFVGSGKGNRHV